MSQIQTTLASQNATAALTPIGGEYHHAGDPPMSAARRVPEGFSFGKPNVMQAWTMWHRGNKHCGKNFTEPVGPFKDIDANDLRGNEFKKVRKVWSDWNAVMSWICKELDKRKPPNWDWRTHHAWSPTTMMMVANLIPDGKLLGLNQRSTQPTKNSVSYVCRLIRKCIKMLQANDHTHLAQSKQVPIHL